MTPYPPYPKWPAELGMKRNNQLLLAERLGWPEGALQACWELEDRHPGWHVSWMGENVTPGWERPAGFWAVNDSVAQHAVEAFRVDVRELEEVLADEPPPHVYGTSSHMRWCDWCLAHPASRPVKL